MAIAASDIEVSTRADDFAREVSSIAQQADNEEELRIGMEAAIRRLADDLEMDVDPENERTVLSGRPDAVYGDLIIEYKSPNHGGDWEHEALYGRSERDSGLMDYMYDIATDRAHDESQQEAYLDNMVGVGTNGHKIFFCRYLPRTRVEPIAAEQTTLNKLSRKEATEGIELVEVYDIRDGARAFLTYLRSLSRKALTSSKLAESFGPEGDVAKKAVNELYHELVSELDDHPRVTTLFNEWNRVFGIVYGDEMGQIHDDRELFGSIYGVEDPDVRPLLFAVHTYYALFMKILVTELLATTRKTPFHEAQLHEPNDDELKRKLSEMEQGKQYELAGVQNFFEEGFFGWYLDAWNEELAESIREIAEELTAFEPATPTIKSEAVRDILKDLYQELVPRVIRHDLGEYLTPDWLAEFTIDEAGFEGDGRALDPACGSGTFLVEAISVVRENTDADGEELLSKILDSVVGFDLNPISVIASRTNYLIALGELAFLSETVRIPVYQCDSILTPASYVDVRSMGNGSDGEAYRISTQEGEFNVPALDDQATIEDLFSLISDYVDMGASTGEFVGASESRLGLGENWIPLVEELYDEITDLEAQNRDGVWTDLLRNQLAPEFVDPFEYIIGNPPWIGWEHLSEDYRNRTKELWDSYGLFTLSGTQARLGGGKKDISMLFTYVVMDEYLQDGGTIGFLITQSVFKSPQAGDGFRRFQLGNGEYLGVVSAHDLVDVQPFEGASNRTGLITLRKGTKTEYPVKYVEWTKDKRGKISSDAVLEEVFQQTSRNELAAVPINEEDNSSPWITGDSEILSTIREAIGESDYTAQAGSCTWANGVYWIEILEEEDDELKIQNLPDMGRKDIPQIEGWVEKTHVYPLLRGREVNSFRIEPHHYILMVQEPEERKGYSEEQMRSESPKTYQFLQNFEDTLRQRSGYKRYFDSDDPFYSIYNVDTSTVLPYKVVWPEQQTPFAAAVVPPTEDEFLGDTPIVPDHKAMLIGLESKDEAHYLCAVLNSSVSKAIVDRYTVSVSVTTHVLENVSIPKYEPDNEVHQSLSECSKRAHSDQADVQEEIDNLTAELWDIPQEKVREVRNLYDELLGAD